MKRRNSSALVAMNQCRSFSSRYCERRSRMFEAMVLKDLLRSLGGRGKHRLSHRLGGIESAAGRIVRDLLQERLANSAAQADRVNRDTLSAHAGGGYYRAIHRVVGDIEFSRRGRGQRFRGAGE